MDSEKDKKIRVFGVYTALAFGASVRVPLALKNKLTRETLISG